jgi:hypothetical protein
MSEMETTAEQPYEVDYKFAPVGLFVCSFWLSCLVAGLIAFAFNVLAAKGFAPHIVDGQRSWIIDDVHGVLNGVAIFVVLFTLSIILGVMGRMATLKPGANLNGLWKMSLYGVPLLTAVMTIGSYFVHP